MRIENWIYFENPGEKEKLRQIMNENDSFNAITIIQQEFDMDLLTASKVVETYNKNIRK